MRWRLPARIRMTLPPAVILNRFATDLRVLIPLGRRISCFGHSKRARTIGSSKSRGKGEFQRDRPKRSWTWSRDFANEFQRVPIRKEEPWPSSRGSWSFMPIEPINPVGMQVSSPPVGRLASDMATRIHRTIVRVAEGMRVNWAEVDPPGLADDLKFETAVDRIGAVQSNIVNALSFTQAQQGALQGVSQALSRMGELSFRGQDITLTVAQQANIQAEFSRLKKFISDTASLQFNGVDLFSSQKLSVTTDADGGSTALQGGNLGAAIGDTGTGSILSGAEVSTPSQAALAAKTLDIATKNIAYLRANIAANTKQLEVSAENLSVMAINMNGAHGRLVSGEFEKPAVELAGDKLLADSAILAFTKSHRFPRPGLSVLA